MTTFTAWLLGLGNASAARNAAMECQRRRVDEAVVSAACADLAQRYGRELTAAAAPAAVAARSAA